MKNKQAELDLIEKENDILSKIEDQLNIYAMLKTKERKEYKRANRARWMFRTFERMRCWVVKHSNPLLANQQMELHFLGQFKESCAVLIIPLISPHVVSCKVNPSIYKHSFRKNFALKWTAPLKNFVMNSMSSICNQIDNTRIETSAERRLKSEVQRQVIFWESSLCRIENAAQELSNVLNRYDATLQLEHNKSSMLINFNHQTRSKSRKLKAQFWINEHYPYCFMEMNIESLTDGINIDYLVRLLNARIKPGYRYLSRTCELIDSFLLS